MQLCLGVFAGLGPLYRPFVESRHGVRDVLSSRGGRHNLVAFPWLRHGAAGMFVVDFPPYAVAVNTVQCFLMALGVHSMTRKHIGDLIRLTHTDS